MNTLSKSQLDMFEKKAKTRIYSVPDMMRMFNIDRQTVIFYLQVLNLDEYRKWPNKAKPDTVKLFIKMVQEGYSREEICSACEIAERTYYTWRSLYIADRKSDI